MKKDKKVFRKRIRVKRNLTLVVEATEVDAAVEAVAVEEVASNQTEPMKMQMVS